MNAYTQIYTRIPLYWILVKKVIDAAFILFVSQAGKKMSKHFAQMQAIQEQVSLNLSWSSFLQCMVWFDGHMKRNFLMKEIKSSVGNMVPLKQSSDLMFLMALGEETS